MLTWMVSIYFKYSLKKAVDHERLEVQKGEFNLFHASLESFIKPDIFPVL